MKQVVIVLALLVCSNVYAHDVVEEPKGIDLEVSYDYYIAPNEGNNYEEGQGISARIHHPIYKNLSGAVGVGHITDVNFPAEEDPKGNWGELRAYGPTYDLRLNLPYNDHLDFFFTGGIGYYFWDFKEGPFLQDNHVVVEVDDAIALRGGVGVEVDVNDRWSVVLEGGWFDTNIDKDARDNTGRVWNILDANEIGLQYIYFKVSGKYEF